MIKWFFPYVLRMSIKEVGECDIVAGKEIIKEDTGLEVARSRYLIEEQEEGDEMA